MKKYWNNIWRFLELIASLILSVFFTWFTYSALKWGVHDFLDIFVIVFFIVLSLASYYQVFPIWFQENFWYCKHCKRLRWVKKTIILNDRNGVTYKTICNKCNNVMSEWKIKYQHDDFDEDAMP